MADLFDKDHQKFIKLLNKFKVEYLLIGGVAVNLYGYSGGTGDIDIWIGPSNSNKEKLIAAVEEFGYDTSEYKKMDSEEITMFSLGSRNEPGHIELTNRIAGVKFEEAYSNVDVKVIEGIKMKVINYNDLITNKRASARPRDIDDVENLSKINREG
jgi:predicted nucleotidyltransferase